MITTFLLVILITVAIIIGIAIILGVITAAVGAAVMLPFAIDILMACLLIKLLFGRKKKDKEIKS